MLFVYRTLCALPNSSGKFHIFMYFIWMEWICLLCLRSGTMYDSRFTFVFKNTEKYYIFEIKYWFVDSKFEQIFYVWKLWKWMVSVKMSDAISSNEPRGWIRMELFRLFQLCRAFPQTQRLRVACFCLIKLWENVFCVRKSYWITDKNCIVFKHTQSKTIEVKNKFFFLQKS